MTPPPRTRRWLGALYLALAALAVPGVLRLEIDNAPEEFFVRDGEALSRYRRFQLDFGRDRFVRLVLSGPGVWTREGLAWLGELERQVADLRGVMGAIGLYGHHAPRLAGWPPPDPAAFRARVLADPLDANAGWVSADGEMVSLLAVLYNLRSADQGRVLAALADLHSRAPPGVEVTLAGLPLIQRAFDDALLEVAARLFPALALLAVLLLAGVLRRLDAVVLPLLFVAVGQTLLLGAMGYLEVRLNLINILLLPLVFVIGLATAVYLLVHFRALRHEGVGAEAALRETYRARGWSVLWAGVTTGIGFGSLAASGVPPVRSLGIWSAVGIGVLTLAAFTFYPTFLALARGRGREKTWSYEGFMQRLGEGWASWAVARRTRIRALFGGTAVLFLAGLAGLRTETDLLAYFRPDHPLRAQAERLEAQGLALVIAELTVARPGVARPGGARPAGRPDGPPPFAGPEDLDRLGRLVAGIRRAPLVLGAVSAADLRQGELPGTGGGTLRQGLEQTPGTGQLAPFFLTSDGGTARVSVLISLRGADQLLPLFDELRRRAETAFPGARVQVTGHFPLILAALRTVLRTMVLSLTATVVLVALILRLLLGSSRLALLALVPNLWPVLAVLGGMGWLGIALDSTTVAIAAVVLGLAVDDTLHALGQFRLLVGRLGPAAAAVATLGRTAPGHLLTTGLLAAGFGICALAGFLPVARFGALAALALAFALAADLILVPVLLAGIPDALAARLNPSGGAAPGNRPPRAGR